MALELHPFELPAIKGRDDLPGLAAYLDGEAPQRHARGPEVCACHAGSVIDARDEDPECLTCGKQPNFDHTGRAAA